MFFQSFYMLCPSVGKSATTVSSLWTSLSVPREKPDSTRPWRVWLWSSFKPSLNYVRVEHRLSCIRRELLVLYYLTIVKIENEEKNAENEDEVAEVAAVTGQSSASKSILKRPVSTDPSSRPPQPAPCDPLPTSDAERPTACIRAATGSGCNTPLARRLGSVGDTDTHTTNGSRVP